MTKMGETPMLDLIGLKCPLPVLRIQKAMSQLKAGECLEIVADDPLAAIDVPHYCREAGHLVLSCRSEGAQLFMVIRKAG